jgi:thioredoxin-dependent peroxiredoxin
MLTNGDRAPSFSLIDDAGKTVDSRSLTGKRYVLYFYPKDDTPGCTTEACAFRDNLPAFDKLGVPVFGLSADDGKSHAKFVRKYALTFPLLSDPDHALLDAYGAWVEKNMYGRTYFGVQRSTFVIGADGRVEQSWPKVSVDGHAEAVLAYLKGATPAAKAQPAAAKKASAKTAAVKAPMPAKKPAAGKPVLKKTAAKNAPASKPASSKPAPSKAPAKKTTGKKTATKKIAPKKAVSKKAGKR